MLLRSISAGPDFSVFLTAAGAIYATGGNDTFELGSVEAAQRSLVPVPVGADSSLELSAAIISLAETLAASLAEEPETVAEETIQLLSMFSFDQLVYGVDETVGDEQLSEMVFAPMLFSMSSLMVPDMEDVVTGTDGDNLFDAKNPLPNKLVLTENQTFVVDKNTVYRHDHFYTNLLQDRKSVV